MDCRNYIYLLIMFVNFITHIQLLAYFLSFYVTFYSVTYFYF